MTGGRFHTRPAGLGTLLCAGMLVTAFVVAAVASASPEPTTSDAEVFSGLRDPGETTDPGLRSLPLLDADGPVVATFPGGAGLDDPDTVDDVLHDLASRLGIDPAIDYLLSTSLQDPDAPPEQSLDLYQGYPYHYVTLDAVVDEWLTPQAVRADPAALLDLSGLLVLAAVSSQRDSAYDSFPNSWAGVAYSLLRRARDVAPSCDIQLDLTFVLTMGFTPHIADVETEVAAAEDDCPDDPTPRWLLGQVQTIQASLIGSFFQYDRGPREMAQAAERTFAGLRTDFPDSPLGWAGSGDLALQLADDAELLGREPFQVRAWRREALESYAAARRISDDPALLAGWGRALSVTGHDQGAIDALTELNATLPGEPAYQRLLVDALVRADRPADLVETVESTPVPERPMMATLSLSPQRAASGEPASTAYGFGGSRAGSVFDQSQKFDAGSSVKDLGFVPVSNGVWNDPWCRAGTLLAALIRVGRALEAYQYVATQSIDPESWDGVNDCHGRPLALRDHDPRTGFVERMTSVGQLGLVAALESGDPQARDDAVGRLVDDYTTPEEVLSEAEDARSDFWRAAGDPGKAQEVIDDWADELPADPWARHRTGELAFLDGDYQAAVAAYRDADRLFEQALADQLDWGDHGLGGMAFAAELEGRAATRLELGAALEGDGDQDAAEAAHLDCLDALDTDDENLNADAADELRFYARSQLGTLALSQGHYSEAADYLEEALTDQYGDVGPPGADDDVSWGRQSAQLPSGAQDNNLALALAKLGRDDESLTYAESALAHDPVDPIFVDTLAFSEDLAGHETAAANAYREALAADPSSYVSANNLAVILAEGGHRDDAADVLADALRAAPDYAIGWHNLGVVQGSASTGLMGSQGALEVASRLDRDLKGRDDLIVDTEIYHSGLDVSKPLRPDWTYAASATGGRDRLTLSLLALMLLRLLWALGLDNLAGKLGERILRREGRRLPGWAAVAASCLVVGLPLALAGHSLLERTVLAASGVAMVALPLLVRALAGSRTTVPVQHYAWAPSLVVGAVGLPFGLVFAPYPVLDAPGAHMTTHPSVVRLRRVVPLVILPVALAFLVLAAVHPAPMARTLALTAFALLGSVLVPVPPLDGSHITSRSVGLVISLGLAAVTAVFTLRWV